jgi:hypothetical protein
VIGIRRFNDQILHNLPEALATKKVVMESISLVFSS